MSLMNLRRLTAVQRYGDEWNSSQRGEEPLRRADRNFADLLQEVRVVLTGVQLLFGFLLTLAVSDRFRSIDPAMKALYVGVLVTAALTIGLFVAPVCYHRRVFQCGRKQELVRVSHRLVTAGLITMWLTVLGAVVLVLSLILHTTMALLVTGLLGVFLAGLWWLLPSCGGGPDERLAVGKGQINLTTRQFFGICPSPSAERDGDAVMDSQGGEADRRNKDGSPGSAGAVARGEAGRIAGPAR